MQKKLIIFKRIKIYMKNDKIFSSCLTPSMIGKNDKIQFENKILNTNLHWKIQEIDKNKKTESQNITPKSKLNIFRKLLKNKSNQNINKRNIGNILPSFSSLVLNQYISLKFFRNIRKDFFTYGDEVNINIIKSLKIKTLNNKETIYFKDLFENNILIILSGEINAYKKNQIKPEILYKGDSILTINYDKIINSLNSTIGEISYEEYKSIYNRYKSLDLIGEKEYFCNLDLFKLYFNWEKVFFSLEKIIYKKGDVITKQGEKMNNFYIIRKGSFQVNYSFVNNIVKELNFDAMDAIAKCPHESFSSVRRYELLDTYNKENLYKIVNLSEGNYIGDLEFYKKSKTYFFTIICDIDGSILYRIPEEKFNLMQNEMFYNILSRITQNKEKIFQDRIFSMISYSNKSDSIRNKFIKIINHKILHSPTMNKTIIYNPKNNPHILINNNSKIKISKNCLNSSSNLKYTNGYEERLAKNLRTPNYRKGVFDKEFFLKNCLNDALSRNHSKKILKKKNNQINQKKSSSYSLIKEKKQKSIFNIQKYLNLYENDKKIRNKLYNSLENKLSFYINNNSLEMSKILTKIFNKSNSEKTISYLKINKNK